MHRIRTIWLSLLPLALLLAGCIGGGDETPVPTEEGDVADEAAPTEATGSVSGKIVTQDLDVVAKGDVALTDAAGTLVTTTQTDAQGRFTMNGVEPGTYRIQISALCCKAVAKQIDVKAGAVTPVNLQLEVLTSEDLQQPHMVPNEWSGFISCGVGAGVPGVRNPKAAVCAIPGALDESLADPNEDFLHEFNLSRGVKTLYVAMDWEPVGGVSGGNLNLLVEQGRCQQVACADAYKYADLDGAPPLVARIDVEDIERDDAFFDNMTEEGYKFRIFAGDGYANLIYQQPFTVYWYAFYWEHAPEDFNPLPDA